MLIFNFNKIKNFENYKLIIIDIIEQCPIEINQ